MGKNKKFWDDSDDDGSDIFESDKKDGDKDDVADESENSDKSVSFIKLKDNGKTEIRYVYHISDIHIRNTSRHDEYKDVFRRVYKKLEAQIGQNKKISIIVLTGDILHSKTEMSPEVIDVTQDFLTTLTEIAPVILIQGNHDCNISNRDRMDALTPIVKNIKENLYYLDKSGIYQYYNIIFGVTDIFDKNFVDASKIGKDVWKAIKQKNKYKIALYHGAVHGAKTDVGFRMNNEELLADDFDGYDYAMLGDIHKFQYVNHKENIAYAGSLIQQSYGESLENHGILKWDLLEGESELLEIKNDYGYCTIEIVDGKMIDTKIPRKPRIRLRPDKKSTPSEIGEIRKNLENEYEVMEVIKEPYFQTLKNKKTSKKVSSYLTQENIIKDHLEKKMDLEPVIIKDLFNLHKKIYQEVLKEKKDEVGDVMHNAIQNQKWKILELQFTNTLSYGKDNVINFRNYDKNKIIGIFAPNYSGKSAIVDVILFCLFEKYSRGDVHDFMNKNENKMYCSILFAIGSQYYFIERIGYRGKDKTKVTIKVNFYSITYDKSGKEKKTKLNEKDKKTTNQRIWELVGNYNDYLRTCFSLQPGKGDTKTINFTNMQPAEKKKYLNEILKLNVFKDCNKKAVDKLKSLSAELSHLNDEIKGKTMKDFTSNIKQLSKTIKKLEKEKAILTDDIASMLDHTIETYAKNFLNNYHELEKYDLTTREKILETVDNLEKRLELIDKTNTDDIEKELVSLKKELSDLENIKEKKDLSLLVEQKEELLKKLVTIPKEYTNLDISVLEKDKTEIGEKISAIDKILSETKGNDINKKLERIDVLKQTISHLKNSIVPVDKDAETKIEDYIKKYNENNDKILARCDEILDGDGINEVYGEDEYKKIKGIKDKFAKHVKQNLKCLKQYALVGKYPSDDFGTSKKDHNDEIIQDIKANEKLWLSDYKKWKTKTEENIKSGVPDTKELFDKSKKYTNEIKNAMLDTIGNWENDRANKKISAIERELELLQEFNNTKKEIDNYTLEKKLLTEKMESINEKIKNYTRYQKSIASNTKINNKIDELKTEIENISVEQKKRSEKIKVIKNKISKHETTIANCKKEINDKKNINTELNLLDKYCLNFSTWSQKNESYNKWLKVKKEFDNDLIEIEKELEKNKMKLDETKKNFENFREKKSAHDKISAKSSLYEHYEKLTNHNGLPYEILKIYLPLIEADVNEILHSLVDFSIEIIYYDEEKIEEQKTNKTNTKNGCIKINICRDGLVPSNVLGSSGFEDFIINIAIKMALCQISLTAKPNFFIIDEGFACLDADNRNNLDPVMNYLKMQYDHIIIISHLEELRNHADYIININRKRKHSHIQASNEVISKRKKKKRT